MGRPTLSAGEISVMETCERVILAHASRAAAENWVQWAKDNEADARLLEVAMRAANA